MATPHVTGVAALLAAQNPARDLARDQEFDSCGWRHGPALAATVSVKR